MDGTYVIVTLPNSDLRCFFPEMHFCESIRPKVSVNDWIVNLKSQQEHRKPRRAVLEGNPIFGPLVSCGVTRVNETFRARLWIRSVILYCGFISVGRTFEMLLILSEDWCFLLKLRNLKEFFCSRWKQKPLEPVSCAGMSIWGIVFIMKGLILWNYGFGHGLAQIFQ